MKKYIITNFNDNSGSTYCLFKSDDEGIWNLFDRVDSNDIKPADGIERLAVKLDKIVEYDLVTSGSNAVRDALRKRFNENVRSSEPSDVDRIVEMLRSEKLTIERRIQQDVEDDLKDPQRKETSRLLKTIELACHSILNPIYPSSFGGDPIDEDPYKRFSRW